MLSGASAHARVLDKFGCRQKPLREGVVGHPWLVHLGKPLDNPDGVDVL